MEKNSYERRAYESVDDGSLSLIVYRLIDAALMGILKFVR